jgi:hypothetical protein
VIGAVVVVVGFYLAPTAIKITVVVLVLALVTVWGVARAQHVSVPELAVLCAAKTVTGLCKGLAGMLVQAPLLLAHRVMHRLDVALRLRLLACRASYAAYDYGLAVTHHLRAWSRRRGTAALESTAAHAGSATAGSADGSLTETA